VYAEEAVQSASTNLGTWTQILNTLQPVQSGFDVSGQTGIPAAFSQFYQAASTWATDTGNSTDQNGVIEAAQGVATAFQQQSAELQQATVTASGQLTNLVGQVNSLAGQIQQDNQALTQQGSNDPAVQANLYNTLQQLSQLVPVTSFTASDGSMTVLLGGQTPLVVGQTQYQIGPAANFQVTDSNGQNITSEIGGGSLGGLLQASASLAKLNGDSSQPGSLNQLAQSFADRVNALLTAGNISTGVAGIPLFTYGTGNPATVAQTLAVNPAITGNQLAAIQPGPPVVANGVALALANLATSTNAADQVGGMNYSAYYGQMAGDLGSTISTATTNQTAAQSMVTQAENIRQTSSGVDLNQEAVTVMQFQRAYDAASKMVTVIDDLTQDVVNMIPAT
jgi:flagellar hook-associated protein 1 FlgK